MRPYTIRCPMEQWASMAYTIRVFTFAGAGCEKGEAVVAQMPTS
jgi:hypothetical protein